MWLRIFLATKIKVRNFVCNFPLFPLTLFWQIICWYDVWYNNWANKVSQIFRKYISFIQWKIKCFIFGKMKTFRNCRLIVFRLLFFVLKIFMFQTDRKYLFQKKIVPHKIKRSGTGHFGTQQHTEWIHSNDLYIGESYNRTQKAFTE